MSVAINSILISFDEVRLQGKPALAVRKKIVSWQGTDTVVEVFPASESRDGVAKMIAEIQRMTWLAMETKEDRDRDRDRERASQEQAIPATA